MIKNLSVVFWLVSAVFISCNSGPDSKVSGSTNRDTMSTEPSNSTVPNEEGWTSLFDGQKIEGWHIHGKNSAGSSWKAVDGVLYLDTTKTQGKRDEGDLVTDKEYENFHFSFEWKLSPGGNSGVIFLVKEDTTKYKRTYETGPEMQVLDNAGHADGKIDKHHAGDLYDLIACSTETVKPVGEWNLAEIKIDKGKLDFYLNGTNVVSTTMWDDNWNRMVAASKFKDMPDFAKFKKGKIALQDHGDPVWFRNIKIKEL
jgi:hypothetical protein